MAYTWRIPICFSCPLPLSPCTPLCSPFVFPSTYLAPSSCDRNRPPPSQVACKLTLFAPPFTQLTLPPQVPRTPPALHLTTTTSGIFRLLLSGTLAINKNGTVRTPLLCKICYRTLDVLDMYINDCLFYSLDTSFPLY